MSGARALFDTNVILYMYGDNAEKGRLARDLFDRHVEQGFVLLSTQVVQEVYAAGARKLAMPKAELREIVDDLLKLPLVRIGPAEIRAALGVEDRYGISFWDALIVAAAESGGARVIYTEDLNQGQMYGSVRAVNPFAP